MWLYRAVARVQHLYHYVYIKTGRKNEIQSVKANRHVLSSTFPAANKAKNEQNEMNKNFNMMVKDKKLSDIALKHQKPNGKHTHTHQTHQNGCKWFNRKRLYAMLLLNQNKHSSIWQIFFLLAFPKWMWVRLDFGSIYARRDHVLFLIIKLC